MQTSANAVVRRPVTREETVLCRAFGRAIAGDEDAFRVIYDATAGRAYGLAARVICNRAQAEEVVQEAYLDLWLHSARFDPDRGDAVSWILMIVHGKAVSRVRSAQARTRREDTFDRLGAPDRSARTDTTYDDVNAAVETSLVRAALATLTAEQRVAIEMAYFGGCTHVEMSGLLGLPLGTVKSRIRSGVQRMREVLDVVDPHVLGSQPAPNGRVSTPVPSKCWARPPAPDVPAVGPAGLSSTTLRPPMPLDER